MPSTPHLLAVRAQRRRPRRPPRLVGAALEVDEEHVVARAAPRAGATRSCVRFTPRKANSDRQRTSQPGRVVAGAAEDQRRLPRRPAPPAERRRRPRGPSHTKRVSLPGSSSIALAQDRRSRSSSAATARAERGPRLVAPRRPCAPPRRSTRRRARRAPRQPLAQEPRALRQWPAGARRTVSIASSAIGSRGDQAVAHRRAPPRRRSPRRARRQRERVERRVDRRPPASSRSARARASTAPSWTAMTVVVHRSANGTELGAAARAAAQQRLLAERPRRTEVAEPHQQRRRLAAAARRPAPRAPPRPPRARARAPPSPVDDLLDVQPRLVAVVDRRQHDARLRRRRAARSRSTGGPTSRCRRRSGPAPR